MRPISPTRRLLSAANARGVAILRVKFAITTEDGIELETEDGRVIETEDA